MISQSTDTLTEYPLTNSTRSLTSATPGLPSPLSNGSSTSTTSPSSNAHFNSISKSSSIVSPQHSLLSSILPSNTSRFDATDSVYSNTRLAFNSTSTTASRNASITASPSRFNSSSSYRFPNTTAQLNETGCPQQSHLSYNPVSLPSNGSGYSYASACLQQHLSYFDASTSWLDSLYTSIYTVITSEAFTSVTMEPASAAVVPPYALWTTCDGYPRIMRNFTPTTVSTNSAYTISAPRTVTTETLTIYSRPGCDPGANPPVPGPKCSIASSDCSSMHPIFATRTASMNPQGICDDAVPDSLQTCTVQAANVQIYVRGNDRLPSYSQNTMC